MSISDAAYWIASEGGRVSFSLTNLQKWQAAFYLLLPLISSGKIAVIGRSHGRGLPTAVPPANFSGIVVVYPYSDSPIELLLCERPHLQCYGIVDEEHWENGFHDLLMAEDWRVPEYSHLQVSNSDLAKEFPFLPSINAVSSLKKVSAATRMQGSIREVCARLWPTGNFPARVQDRDKAIIMDFKDRTETPPSSKTIQRALKGEGLKS